MQVIQSQSLQGEKALAKDAKWTAKKTSLKCPASEVKMNSEILKSAKYVKTKQMGKRTQAFFDAEANAVIASTTLNAPS